MKLNIENALEQTGDIFHAELEGALHDESLPDDCVFACPVSVSLDYTLSDDGLFVWGRLKADLTAICARCLKELGYTVETEFSEVFKKEANEDDEEYPYDGENVVLDKMLEDKISLALPVRFLCSEDCKGLCPECGADLNEGDCGCANKSETDETSPFAGLKGLFDDTREV